MKKLKVAVTGGIGSGKSSLCTFYEEKGYPVFSSDAVAKELMVSDPAVKKKIIKNFGPKSYTGSKLNKEYLASEVFSDPQKTALINSIVHPATTKEVQNRIEKAFLKHDIVFVESALVYEARIEKHFDYVILVTSSDEDKIARVVKRDKADPASIKMRMDNQIPDDKKKNKADFTIKNDSSRSDLLKRGEFILTVIQSISKGE